jgi:uncharacterized protein YlxP (DUF503 family)
MPVAILIVELEIAHAQSLKDRRQVVRSIKDTVRHGFNVSVAELDEAVVWNRATLGFAAISGSAGYLRGQMQELEKAVERLATQLGATVEDAWVELVEGSESSSSEGESGT